VTMVTPVANMPSAWRKSLGSNVVGCCIADSFDGAAHCAAAVSI
jgi:hypothetical protein